jgi:hypothetical protein
MKTSQRNLVVIVAFASALVQACGAPTIAPTSAPTIAPTSAPTAAPIPIEFTGNIERMEGLLWVISGRNVTVAPTIVGGAVFQVGDAVRVQGLVNADGSITALRIEPVQGVNDNTNDGNTNDDNSNNGNDNSNGDNSNGGG